MRWIFSQFWLWLFSFSCLAAITPNMLVEPINNTDEIFEQGLDLFQGRKGETDVVRGLQLIEKAAQFDYTPAQAYLGLVYTYYNEGNFQPNPMKGFYWLKLAAARGYLDGRYHIAGKSIVNGELKMDDKKAVEDYQYLASKNHTEGKLALAKAYENGKGIKQDKKKAFELYRELADNKEAQFHVAQAYFDGNKSIVAKDLKKAAEFMEKSAKQGFMPAKCMLGLYYVGGFGVEVSLEQSAEWFKQCDEHKLGMSLEIARQAMLAMVAKHPNRENTFSVGILYWIGKIMPQNDKEAVKWIEKSAQLGSSQAQLLLGEMYLKGIDGQADQKKAIYWFKKASAKELNANCYLAELSQTEEEYQRYLKKCGK